MNVIESSMKIREKHIHYIAGFFEGDLQIQICKELYLTSLNISSRRVSYHHERKNEAFESPALFEIDKVCKYRKSFAI